MREHRSPQNNGMCPFYVVPDDPLSASASVDQCVACVTRGYAVLDGLRDDFRQTAYLTILEETPEYDPVHPSRASFITFIKSRVCGSLWTQRRQELKHLPFADTEVSTSEDSENLNPLAVYLYSQACASESLEDAVIRKIEVEELRARLPEMLSRLTPKERKLIDLKYFMGISLSPLTHRISIGGQMSMQRQPYLRAPGHLPPIPKRVELLIIAPVRMPLSFQRRANLRFSHQTGELLLSRC